MEALEKPISRSRLRTARGVFVSARLNSSREMVLSLNTEAEMISGNTKGDGRV
jgi:hypothetical protein